MSKLWHAWYWLKRFVLTSPRRSLDIPSDIADVVRMGPRHSGEINVEFVVTPDTPQFSRILEEQHRAIYDVLRLPSELMTGEPGHNVFVERDSSEESPEEHTYPVCRVCQSRCFDYSRDEVNMNVERRCSECGDLAVAYLNDLDDLPVGFTPGQYHAMFTPGDGRRAVPAAPPTPRGVTILTALPRRRPLRLDD